MINRIAKYEALENEVMAWRAEARVRAEQAKRIAECDSLLSQRTHGFDAEPLYTAEQMQAYAADRIEAQAARIAEYEIALRKAVAALACACVHSPDFELFEVYEDVCAALAPKESSDD